MPIDAGGRIVNRERLRTLREERGWSLDDAGGRAGYGGHRPGSQSGKLESGRFLDPPISVLYRAAAALGVDLLELLVDPPRGPDSHQI